jgi:hypothetical protein
MQDKIFSVLTPLIVTAVMVLALLLGLRPPADRLGAAPAPQFSVSTGSAQLAQSGLIPPGDS